MDKKKDQGKPSTVHNKFTKGVEALDWEVTSIYFNSLGKASRPRIAFKAREVDK